MFKILEEIFGKKNLMQESIEESWEMLQLDKEMLDASIMSLRKQDTEDVEIDLYKTDKEINRLERDVRKKVITHLAVSSASDLSIGLTLVSIISDIERIGDYTKNIYELAKIHPNRLTAGKWEDDLVMIENMVSNHLGNLKKALKEAKEELGRNIIIDLAKVKDKCDDYIMLLIKGEEESFKVSEAVPLALYLRYLKRVSGHMQNVASSIVNPFHRLKYEDKHIKLIDNKEQDGKEELD